MMYKKLTGLFLCGSLWLQAVSQENIRPVVYIPTGDSVVTFASTLYEPHSFFRKLVMGSNYREVWQQYVTVPVFRFSKAGFTIKELGGGMQTKSLHMSDPNGKHWSLRTIDKDVSQADFAAIKTGLGFKIAQDLISAAFPYAAAVAGELAYSAGIPSARPQIYFVADDTSLGRLRPIFANTLCMLEERDPGFDSTDNSLTLLQNIRRDNRYKIQQPLLLKARLLDMLMADWDRHEGNWRWGVKDSAGFNYYYAVPRDRDWTFYKSGGWLPKLLQSIRVMPHLVSFTRDLRDVKHQSQKAWTIDKELLNEMDAADWQATITEVQLLLTDNVIETAVKRLPAEVYASAGQEFIDKLKTRRTELGDEAMKYYKFQAEEIIINGSDKEETFSVTTTNDSLMVTVTDTRKTQLYKRSFSSSETYLITMNGYGGADVFEMDEKIKSKIRIHINGGKGADQYNIKGDVRTKIYDIATENNMIVNKGGAKLFLK